MKSALYIACMALFVSSACCAADTETRFLLHYFMPSDSATWDNGYSVEAQYVWWKRPDIGFLCAGGVGTWNVNSKLDVGNKAGLGPSRATRVDGSATIFPVGVSLVYNPDIRGAIKTDFGNVPLLLEAGIRYVFVSSGVDTTERTYDGSDTVYITEDLDIGDSLMGIVAADIVFPVPFNALISFGLGYQFDIMRGTIDWAGYDLGGNRFKAVVLRLGVTLKM
ncbi:MAG: hypothetical protein ACP5G0_03410 [Desulfomonilia bacterium]